MRISDVQAMLLPGEIFVDNFAGGGGASTGIEMALGRSPDHAINHDEQAVALHAANHPNTIHHCQSVWRVDPQDICAGRPVGGATIPRTQATQAWALEQAIEKLTDARLKLRFAGRRDAAEYVSRALKCLQGAGDGNDTSGALHPRRRPKQQSGARLESHPDQTPQP